MYQFTPSQLLLMNILADGKCHTGNELGQAIGVSRSAIWKQINQLNELGVPVIHVQQKGYRLPAPLILLDPEKLRSSIESQGFNYQFNLHLPTTIGSTNTFLKELPQTQVVDVCCTEMQTQGRGRFGRYWHSPFGENIYCSSRWNLNCDLSRLSGLSLVISLAIIKTLKHFIGPEEIGVKWPNDILWKGKKLSGCLIEILAESNSTTQIIIGIGININSDTKCNPLLDASRSWISLFEITNQYYDRNIIISTLLNNLSKYIDIFLQYNLQTLLPEWDRYDYLKNKKISICHSNSTIEGTAKGINQNGELILEDCNGVYLNITSGDASIRSV